MRIHTSAGFSAIAEAARIAGVDIVKSTTHGSRKRDHAFDVLLEGNSRRRPNGGSSGAGSGYAATWDQWGVFLAHIFEIDPDMTCWAYADAEAFHYRTNHRFDRDNNDRAETGAEVGLAASLLERQAAPGYWPNDAHGDHTFRYDGRPGEQKCRKCTAVQRWSL